MDTNPNLYNPVSGTSADNSSETTTRDDNRGADTPEYTDTVSSLCQARQHCDNSHQNRKTSCEFSSLAHKSRCDKKRRNEKELSTTTKKRLKKPPKQWIQEQHEDLQISDPMEKLDLATVEGQMAVNKGMSLAKAKDEAKREYNRRNAARARTRNKVMVTKLQNKVAELVERIEKQEKEKSVLEAQLALLSKPNLDIQNLWASAPPAAQILPPLHHHITPASGPNFSSNQAQQLIALLALKQQAPAPKPVPSRDNADSAVDFLSLLAGRVQQQQQLHNQHDQKPSALSALSQLITTSNQLPPPQLRPATTEQQHHSETSSLLRTMSPQEIYAMLRERELR